MDAQNFNTAVEDLIAKVVGGKALDAFASRQAPQKDHQPAVGDRQISREHARRYRASSRNRAKHVPEGATIKPPRSNINATASSTSPLKKRIPRI